MKTAYLTFERTTEINLDSDEVGKQLADANSDFQAEVINRTGSVLKQAGVGNAIMQASYIVSDLDDEGRWFILALADSIKGEA